MAGYRRLKAIHLNFETPFIESTEHLIKGANNNKESSPTYCLGVNKQNLCLDTGLSFSLFKVMMDEAQRRKM